MARSSCNKRPQAAPSPRWLVQQPESPMRKTDLFIVAAADLLIALGVSCETVWAQTLPPASNGTATLYGGSREYRWTFYVPVMTFERREIVVQVPATTVRSRRWDYEVPALRAQRFKLGQVAAFT